MTSSNQKEAEIDRTVEQATKITAREGYTFREWMWALNLAAGGVPQNLRMSAEILTALSTGRR